MAPILSLLRSMAERGIQRKATFYYGARRRRDLCFEKELFALQEKLPDYLVPSAFVMLDELPLTSSGKLNRRALPAPEIPDRNAELTGAAPRTPTEKLLAEIWRDVLGVSQIGIHENFFDLGGHSLLAVRLFAQIENLFDIDGATGSRATQWRP